MVTRHWLVTLLFLGRVGAAATPAACPAEQTFVALSRAEGQPLSPRIEVVMDTTTSLPEGCSADESITDCAFDDSARTIAPRLRAVAEASHQAWANTVDGGACLPTGLVGRAALKFAEGQVSVSGVQVTIPPPRPVVVNVHLVDGGPVEADVLLSPPNVVGRTDGGVWSGLVLGQVREVSVVPIEQTLPPRTVYRPIGKRLVGPDTQFFSIDVRAPLAPPVVQVLGGLEGGPVSVRAYGWNRAELAHAAALPEGRTVSLEGRRGLVTALVADGRSYVIEAQQGNLMSAAVIDARSSNVLLTLSEPAVVRLRLNDPKGRSVPILWVDVVESSDCSGGENVWAQVKPPKPSAVVEVRVPPGPNRCLKLWWQAAGPFRENAFVGVRVPISPGTTQVTRTVKPDEAG